MAASVADTTISRLPAEKAVLTVRVAAATEAAHVAEAALGATDVAVSK